MACKNCKKKKAELEKLKTNRKPIIELDRAMTWLIVVWFFLGIYGMYSLMSLLFGK